MSRIVIAFGGNALGNNPIEQQELIDNAVRNLIPLIKAGHGLVLTHGNGPQVGMINLAFENGQKSGIVPYMPFAECTAMSEGYIGFHLQKGLNKVLKQEKIKKKVVSIVTEVAVDKNDPSFKNPTKPVGSFYTKEEADKLSAESGEIYIEDAGRGYRRVVASPKPVKIIELGTIKDLLRTKHIVIAGGGGGIPVNTHDNSEGLSAVIDKDLLSSLMAIKIKADKLVILTNVKQAEINYNTKDAKKIGKITLEEAQNYVNEGHFAKGSMLPKIEAAMDFVKNTGNEAIITELNNLANALDGKEATIITK